MSREVPIDCGTLSKRLYSAVLSDVLDSLGYARQAMRSFIRPISDDVVMFGPARTGLFVPIYGIAEGENPYEIEIELIDDLKPGEIAVFACTGPAGRLTPWGELLTTAALQRRAGGFVTDGHVRDTRAIRQTGFPVFHGGINPLDTRGRGKMMARDVPVECADVLVNSGDYVFGDIDGVVVIPSAVAGEVVNRAVEKISGENTTRNELVAGSSLADVYRKYGVL